MGAQGLAAVYSGWDDHQISLVRAIAPLAREHLLWRPAPQLRSVGEVAGHIIAGRVNWFHRVLGAGSVHFAEQVAAWRPEDAIEEQADELVRWLEATWGMIQDALGRWTVADLAETLDLPPYQGKKYALTRQWVLWRVLSHDIHHGGELAFMLGMQGIAIPELGDEGGHLTERARATRRGLRAELRPNDSRSQVAITASLASHHRRGDGVLCLR